MHHIICHVLFGFFIILGICDVIIFLMSKIFKSRKSKKIYTFFIPVKNHTENIEFIIRSMMFKFNFLHPFLNFKIIIIDNGMDGETKIICHNLCKIYRGKIKIVKNQTN